MRPGTMGMTLLPYPVSDLEFNLKPSWIYFQLGLYFTILERS